MKQKTIWSTSEDGSIEYVQITEGLLQESLEAMHRSFYINENVCVALGLPDRPECFPEMDKLVSWVAEDGISIAAVDKATGKVAGVAFNKLHVCVEDILTGTDTMDVFAKHLKLCEHSEVRNLLQWMCDIEKIFDICEHCKVKTAMEIMFVGILPEFRKRGIAKKLFEVSISIAKRLSHGKEDKVISNGTTLAITRPPEIVTAICTSFITHKIAEQLRFELGAEIGFDRFEYDGRSLASKIAHSQNLTFEFLRL
ncbi:uncharacterized protein LOC109535764 isoform X1 [Dendroctonus ponderosae]|uniref:N-acetyltransferase domain-containing protein n=1 Tax=Dendroctonus ponderosae TaxID=77166 RepID=U4UXX8_DENPD|nr:uncharacterized protein LOC109535764 isoform X1 [Dendroctonus ponderosae]ERL95221.1 hypothetical protein D910_12488 [Dendroctonus ponderosae]KAH1024165.1 hypothetical protein HUJ05_003699 [Dendroctonus ponderosae]